MKLQRGEFYYKNGIRIFLYTDGVFDVIKEKPHYEFENIQRFLAEKNNIDDCYALKLINSIEEISSIFPDNICLVDVKIS